MSCHLFIDSGVQEFWFTTVYMFIYSMVQDFWFTTVYIFIYSMVQEFWFTAGSTFFYFTAFLAQLVDFAGWEDEEFQYWIDAQITAGVG